MKQRAKKEEILKAIEDVPLLSPSASRLLQITSQEDHDIHEVIDIVKCDSSLTARVLKIVNSVAYGLAHEVTTIDRAVSYLGERMVAGIALGDSASALFHKELQGYEGPKSELWNHDLRTAIAAREIARFAKVTLSADLAFTAGILHAVGKAVLSDFLGQTANDVLVSIDDHEVEDYLAGERELLGIDHTEAGYVLAKNWELPESLQMAIRYHHMPAEAPDEYKPLVYAVHLGCIVAMMCGSQASDSLQYHLDKKYTDYFDLSSEQIASVMLEVNEEFDKLDCAMSDTKEKSR
ncbi:HDOD domain-containing protein [Desulfuromonas acetoxidans]|uniref:Signal transduction protein n=1 Tax=Desulfuromonas acetoxidans (strain DSM 684 / 11070) TaxID=281689 RepID=Q1JZU8_DESA6|nr:HDOD domain-containing protein [Desulfuromonas acetoxidans]EAT15794.1 putative signal transduction protein [Desulfuromonas acetoxidans DSM 684]MBF0645004.1 HDOD domain-containing protein [Desulfuromonas acetoxidans]NVD25660.1 HDOD domain-containing protein [Desulfuromonas acetoxidans]NVE17713.1 HDOD domain-containing protein [Desulfuromonas acetoxidans]